MPESEGSVDLDIPGLLGGERIGSGGFGTVYLATQSDFDRRVAVKMLDDRVQDERMRTRFRRECLALGRLSGHPNIITVFGGGFTSHDRPYLLMEYMSGGSLADRKDAAGRVDWRVTLAYMARIAGALETAHRAGILHRDIKPENILLSSYGEPILADFGIARLNDSPATQTTAITTSIAHACPEIFDGHEPTAAWDIYALGSTMFTAVSGRYAFVRESDESVLVALSRIVTEPVPDLRSEGVPEAVCDVLETAMSKTPDGRFPSALEMGRSMQLAQRELGLDLTPIIVEGEPPLPPKPKAIPRWPTAMPRPGAPDTTRVGITGEFVTQPIGHQPQPHPQPQPQASTSRPSNPNLTIIVGVLAAILLVLLVVAFTRG